jgi:hypothetical protein
MPFYFWTVILGMAIGATLTWFLVADHPFESREAPAGPVDDLEAGVIADRLKDEGIGILEDEVVRVLQAHAAYIVGTRSTGRASESEPDAEDQETEGELEAEGSGEAPAAAEPEHKG